MRLPTRTLQSPGSGCTATSPHACANHASHQHDAAMQPFHVQPFHALPLCAAYSLSDIANSNPREALLCHHQRAGARIHNTNLAAHRRQTGGSFSPHVRLSQCLTAGAPRLFWRAHVVHMRAGEETHKDNTKENCSSHDDLPCVQFWHACIQTPHRTTAGVGCASANTKQSEERDEGQYHARIMSTCSIWLHLTLKTETNRGLEANNRHADTLPRFLCSAHSTGITTPKQP